jgi:Flp pilus assembly protein TadG
MKQRGNQQTRDRRRNESGAVIVVCTIGMLAFFLAAGLAIDISHIYTTKSELQSAADAAALAAASQLNSTSGGIKLAVAEATKSLNKYDFKTDVTLSPSDVTFATNLNGSYISQASAEASPASIRFVKVTLPPKQVGLTFAALAIGPTQAVTASATAGLSVGLSMNKFYTAYTFIEPSATPMVKGQVYTLDAKAQNDSTPTSYRVLAGPDGDLLLTGQIHAYGYIGTDYTVANLPVSEMCRYAKIGMNTRFADYSVHPSANPVDEPPDTITQENITYAQYTTMQGNGIIQRADGLRNRRIMTVPIAPNNTYNTSTRTVTANKLAAFFIRRKVGTDCKLEVEFIGAPIAVPEGTYTPGGVQMNDLSIPVLYK